MAKMIFEVAMKVPSSGLILFEEVHGHQWFIEKATPEKFFKYQIGQWYELRFGLPFLRLVKPQRREHGETSINQGAANRGHPRSAQEQAHA